MDKPYAARTKLSRRCRGSLAYHEVLARVFSKRRNLPGMIVLKLTCGFQVKTLSLLWIEDFFLGFFYKRG